MTELIYNFSFKETSGQLKMSTNDISVTLMHKNLDSKGAAT